MRNDVLERKIARIVLAIAQELGVSEEKAISVFYATETYKQLVDPRYGLQLMSDGYILDDVHHRESVGTDPVKRTPVWI